MKRVGLEGRALLLITVVMAGIGCTDYLAERDYERGASALRVGQLDRGIESLYKALARKPEYPEAHERLGSAFLAKGELDSATAAFEAALAQRDSFPGAHFGLAKVHAARGAFRSATTSFRRATRRAQRR